MFEFVAKHIIEIILITIITTFLLTYYMIPKIINVVNHKELMESPNKRSSHVELTPTFGGISFFVILMLTLLLLNSVENRNLSINIAAALTILLFTGLKDDLVVISYQAKLLGQLIASILLLFNSELYNINFNGFLGLYELNIIISIFISILIIITVINAFNLIDGVDGLAASTGIIILSMYAIIYYLLDDFFLILICISLIGSLLAFLRFNLSSKRKIFMGDTGSLIIGFIVALMSLNFLNLDASSIIAINFLPQNAPFVVLSILIFPLFDLIRIIMVRISKKQHPLLADKNHSHHILIDLGNSHIKTSMLISFFSLLISTLLLYLTMVISNFWMLVGIFIIAYLIFLALFFKLSLNRE